MKKLFFIFTIVFNFQIVLGQELIAVVDTDKLINAHPLNSHYDSIYNSFKNSLIDSLESLEVEYNCKVNGIGWGHYPKSITSNETAFDSIINQELKELKDIEGRIINFQSEMKTKLTSLKVQHLELIKQEVIIEIKKFNTNNRYSFILDKSLILFSEHEIDLTNAILKEYKNK